MQAIDQESAGGVRAAPGETLLRGDQNRSQRGLVGKVGGEIIGETDIGKGTLLRVSEITDYRVYSGGGLFEIGNHMIAQELALGAEASEACKAPIISDGVPWATIHSV